MTDEDIRLRMLDWRGIEEGQECSRCGGAGTLAYSSTATWRGGAGGSTITTDVCATCWGSGTKRPWPNWRRIAADAEIIKASRQERDAVKEALVEAREIISAREAAYDTAQEGLRHARKQEAEMRETIRDARVYIAHLEAERVALRAQVETLRGALREMTDVAKSNAIAIVLARATMRPMLTLLKQECPDSARRLPSR